MNKSLSAFLFHEEDSKKEVNVSERFKDEKGNIIPFTIRPILADEAQRLMKQNTRTNKKTGIQEFESSSYQADMIASAVLYPDLKNADLQASYGVFGESELLTKMLRMGEYTALRDAIFELSGMYDDINEKIEESKN